MRQCFPLGVPRDPLLPIGPCISLAITGIGGGIWETRFGKSFVECAWRTVAERATIYCHYCLNACLTQVRQGALQGDVSLILGARGLICSCCRR